MLVASIFSALAIAGCGGSSSDSTSALSHQEFATQANAACRQANDQIAALPAPTTLAGFSTLAAQYQPIALDLQRKLQGVTPPPEDEDTYNALLSALGDLIDKLAALRAAAEAGNLQEAQSLGNDINSSPFNTLATDLGLTECAKNVQPQG